MAESRGGRWTHNADNNRLTHSPDVYKRQLQGQAIPDKPVKGTSVVLSERRTGLLLAGQTQNPVSYTHLSKVL